MGYLPATYFVANISQCFRSAGKLRMQSLKAGGVSVR